MTNNEHNNDGIVYKLNDKEFFCETFRKFVNSEYLTEVRIIKNTCGVINLFFDDIEKLYDAIVPHNGIHNIYWTINPISKEHFRPAAGGTKDDHISKRQYILIDIDTIRDKSTSATDEQLEEARKVAEEVVKQFDRNEKVVIMSGNGYHILFRCDILNDVLNTMRVRNFLEAVSRKFSNDFCRIDTNVYNASRIVRIPYTINVKGNIYREAAIISVKRGKILSSMSLDLFCRTEKSKLNEPNNVRIDSQIPNNVRIDSQIPNNVRIDSQIPNNVLDTKIRIDSQIPNNVRIDSQIPNNVLDTELEKTDFFDALNKCRKWLKTLYTEAKKINVRKGEGRILTLAIMSELKANGLKDPHFACKWLFGSDYDYAKTEKEWRYIHDKPFRSETLCAEFPAFCNVNNTKIFESNRRIETLINLKKTITRTTFNNDRLKSVYTIYFQNGLDFDVDAVDIAKLATWKSITSAAGYVIGWRGITNDILDLVAWIMDNCEIVEAENPDVDEIVPQVEHFLYKLSYAKEKQQLRGRPIKFYEEESGDILVAASTMKIIREKICPTYTPSQFYKLLLHTGVVKGKKLAGNVRVWIYNPENLHNEGKYKTQCGGND